jgi:hypothetical protein
MNRDDRIEAYLQEFARQLQFHGFHSRRVLDEIRDHLQETMDELCRQGMEPAAAAAAAIERFGSPPEVVERFELETPLESEVEIMIRYLLMPVAVLTFLFGALFMVGSLFDDAHVSMFVSKLVASAIMMGCSVILFYQGWTTGPLGNWQRGLALAAALLSIMIGSMGGVFTAHLGLVTKDWEMYGFVGGGLLILQGVLATIELVWDGKPPVNLTA